MANTKSAKKMVRKIATRTQRNQARRSRMRGFLRRARAAVQTKDTGADTLVAQAVPEIMRAAQKGVLHKRTAARYVSRLQQQLQLQLQKKS